MTWVKRSIEVFILVEFWSILTLKLSKVWFAASAVRTFVFISLSIFCYESAERAPKKRIGALKSLLFCYQSLRSRRPQEKLEGLCTDYRYISNAISYVIDPFRSRNWGFCYLNLPLRHCWWMRGRARLHNEHETRTWEKQGWRQVRGNFFPKSQGRL